MHSFQGTKISLLQQKQMITNISYVLVLGSRVLLFLTIPVVATMTVGFKLWSLQDNGGFVNDTNLTFLTFLYKIGSSGT